MTTLTALEAKVLKALIKSSSGTGWPSHMEVVEVLP